MRVDSLGLIWGLAVLAAHVTDPDGAQLVRTASAGSMPRLTRLFADSADHQLWHWVRTRGKWVLPIVTRRPDQVGFAVQPKRWIVERTFGWFGRYRRLAKDYEVYTHNSETWVQIAMIHRMSRFTFPEKHFDEDIFYRHRKVTQNE